MNSQFKRGENVVGCNWKTCRRVNKVFVDRERLNRGGEWESGNGYLVGVVEA